MATTSSKQPKPPTDFVINLDHGDPTMYEEYWKKKGEKATLVISGSQTMSYFSDPSNTCWFLEQRLAAEVRRLHKLVGNAKADDKHVVVGTGSSQLFQAALYALAPSDVPHPIDVVSSTPYYSAYPTITGLLKSKLYQWAGDARAYKGDGSCIEVVCSPNNPDGFLKEPLLKSDGTNLIHDLAYYWPQYTPISHEADHQIMLFTISKCTGHAGTRIGWALVKDEELAKRMTEFIEVSTIGVSKDSQLRAAKILSVVTNGLEHRGKSLRGQGEEFFQYGRLVMEDRWKRLREVVERTGAFTLPKFPLNYCHFRGKLVETCPAFAWMRCMKEGVEDCHALLKSRKILTRGGVYFGEGAKYVRVSMLDCDPSFQVFLDRISAIGKSN